MSLDNTYIQLLGELKERIRQAQQRATLAVNTEMLAKEPCSEIVAPVGKRGREIEFVLKDFVEEYSKKQ